MKYTQRVFRKDDEVELSGALKEFREALIDEIEKIKKSGQSSTMLSAGQRIPANGAEFWCCFRVEYMPMLPADPPLQAAHRQKSVSCDSSQL